MYYQNHDFHFINWCMIFNLIYAISVASGRILGHIQIELCPRIVFEWWSGMQICFMLIVHSIRCVLYHSLCTYLEERTNTHSLSLSLLPHSHHTHSLSLSLFLPYSHPTFSLSPHSHPTFATIFILATALHVQLIIFSNLWRGSSWAPP